MRNVLAAALLLSTSLFAGLVVPRDASAQTRDLATGGVLLDRIAAVVNEGVVLQSELDEQLEAVTERLRAQRTELPPQNVLRQQILERLVLQEIQVQRADRLGLKVSDEVLNNALRDIAQRNGLTLDQLPDALASQGINYAAFRDSMRKEMTIQMLRQRDVLGRVIITPRELDQAVARMSSAENQEYDVSHILLSLPQAAEPGQIEEVTKRAQDIQQRAANGEDFAQLAVAYSNAQTALDGGKLGWRKGSELPGFIADLVAKLEPGQVSAPTRTPSGFHIVKLNEKRSAGGQVMVDQAHARHILIRPNALQDDAAVEEKLQNLRERILAGEDFAELAQTNSEDPGSSAEGGDLGWKGPGTFVPEFEEELNKLQKGEISRPFKTQFGWHIAQLLDRRTHDNSAEENRRRAYEALRASKADEEAEVWLRRLRDEAYVEYKL
jgi:peptidyl-prolyl cis-trans isomerase SurA